MNLRQETGKLGELAARRHLESIGFAILGMNVRCGRHEIDIIAEQGEVLVFVEVRARRSRKFGAPEESITLRKRKQMLAAAQRYLTDTDSWHRTWRIDIVAVEIDHLDRVARIDCIPNAVEMDGN